MTKIINSKKDLLKELEFFRSKGKSIGFVPTMGALHEGHLSLIRSSNQKDEITVVSIFINPTQFNNPNDYDKYPRILDDDIQILRKVKCDILFSPSEKEMYPEEDKREFNFGNLDKVMEGKHRPGHFRGVALIVSKLFEIIQPDRAYFGEKDFQQLAIIKDLNKKLGFNIEIVPCPIIREKDGLAMSSRNMLLTKEQRENVPLISKTLFKAKEISKSLNVSETKQFVIRTINENPFLDVEYFEIIDGVSLESVDNWDHKGKIVGCIAVHVDTVRLIDNIRFYS